MLLKNKRFSRALAFKDRVVSLGRDLDLNSYGSLIEYCGDRGQLGSAVMLLRECLSIHGSPPGERSLKKIRSLCRREEGLEDDLGLVDMIGEDPLRWLREGEATRRRDMTYRGRRDVDFPRNRLVHI